MSARTPCIWVTGSQDDVCKADYYPFFIQRCCGHGMIAREYNMVHEDLLNFIGGFKLGAEAQAFYLWLGDYIRHHGGRDCSSPPS